MTRILQALLALISLLLLAWLATRADGAACDASYPACESAVPWASGPAGPLPPRFHVCLRPGAQPATHLQGQPFAYGYFGARARPMAAYQESYHRDWCQWTIFRAD